MKGQIRLWSHRQMGALGHTMVIPLTQYLSFPRTPAMIGCSFVVDREYFGDIGLLDPGMEVYGAENIELGMRVSRRRARMLWGVEGGLRP